MSDGDSRVDAFVAKAERWQTELEALRAILRACPVAEDFKWRSPCYTFETKNIAALWGLKDYCAVAFFKGVLLKDPAGLLVAPGDNSRSMRLIKFTGASQIAGCEATLKAYVGEAVEVEKAGLKVALKSDDLALPEELAKRLQEDPDLKAAFAALTPGRRRGYLLHFSQAKQSATRHKRIAACRPRILEGKGLHDR